MGLLWFLMLGESTINFGRILHGAAAFCIGIIFQTLIVPKLPLFREFLRPDPLNPSALNMAPQYGANLHAGATLATLLVVLLVSGLWWLFGFELHIQIVAVSAMSSGIIFFYHANA
jgi:hypothetical protein